jgi:hypothetical protein
MEHSVERTAEQIYQKGGEEVARLLSDLFKSLGDNLDRDFEPDQVIDDLFGRLGGYEIPENGTGTRSGYGINIIPSNERPGSCCRLCVSFATKGFSYSSRARIRTKKAFNEVMLMQSAYWFACMGINVENLILTPNWNQQAFESNYQPIIDNYCNIYSKKVFVVEVSKVGLILRYPY